MDSMKRAAFARARGANARKMVAARSARASVSLDGRASRRSAGELLGRVHAGEQSRRIAEARELVVAERLGVGSSASSSAPARRAPASSSARQVGRAPAAVPGAERLAQPAAAVHRDHGACTGFPATAQLAQQLRGHEGHVPRDDERPALPRRAPSAVASPPRGPRPGVSSAHDALAGKPFAPPRDRWRSPAASSWRRAARPARGRRCAVRPAAPVPWAAPRNDARRPPRGGRRRRIARRCALTLQMRSPRCSAARSSSVVSARSTMNDSTPRRGRSLMKRPQALHITRS